MFKRIEKRLRRKKIEDELGLDDEAKEVFGINDTDSDESDSDSNLSSDREPDDGEDAALGEEEDGTEDGFSEEEEHSDGNPERALITVEEALSNPIYLVSLDPDIRECIVCPGKQLKGAKMTETHKSSNAHERRFKQFEKQAALSDPNSKAQVLLEKAMDEIPITAPKETSRRAEKRHIAKEKRKAEREKFKARHKKRAALIDVARDSFIKSNEEKRQEKGVSALGEREKKAKARKEEVKEQKTGGKQAVVKETISKQLPEGGKWQYTKGPTKRKVTESQESPRKKRKALDHSIPSTGSAKTEPPQSKDIEPAESPEAIQELQAQVKDIIQSASSLAKAARARALSGEGKPLLARKKKSARTPKA